MQWCNECNCTNYTRCRCISARCNATVFLTVACTSCTLLLNKITGFPFSREHEVCAAADEDLAGNVLRDQLCHLEHRHLLLAAKNSLELVVGIDVAFVPGVLEPVLLDVHPETLRELTA